MLAKPLRLQLLIIRSAMLLGVLGLGVFSWFRHREGTRAALDGSLLQTLSYGCYAGLAATLLLLVVLRTRVAAAPANTQMLLYLGGYGAAEMVAILGGAIWLFGGERIPYLLGVVLMTLSFQLLPIPRD